LKYQRKKYIKKSKLSQSFKVEFKTMYYSITKKLGSKNKKIKKSLPRAQHSPQQRGSLPRAGPRALGRHRGLSPGPHFGPSAKTIFKNIFLDSNTG
jgi:hypothetical protein